jgi:hypothetical protein
MLRNNSRNVLFNPDTILFRNYPPPIECSKYNMRVHIIVFYFHCNKVNKVEFQNDITNATKVL